ncbi:MAG: hypothetical protein PHP28_07630 [Actinomycetota bacterium]|nr:hypothetical protein [Actinomycetota bacterium]MDD5667497.1 hypothetical protein [Actinomycetota bacterium]
MKKVLFCIVLTAALVLPAMSLPAFALPGEVAVEVSTIDLLESWQELDGREVILRGEAVGDVMRRGDYAWITVNDDSYSREARLESGELRGGNSGIGVWLPTAEADKIEVLGRYGTAGDLVEVRGVFNAGCNEHGGDFDIHAHSLAVLDPGRDIPTSPDSSLYIAAVFSGIFLVATLTPLLRRRAQEMRSARALLRKEEEEQG